MSKKKGIILSIVAILLIIVGIGTYFFLTKEDEKTTLNLIDKQWIENNKNNIIDIEIINNIPIFNYEGEGVIFDFIKSIEEDTGLEFNEISYNISETPTANYSIVITQETQENDIVLYEDNYAIITANKIKYDNLNDIPSMIVGVLSSDLENVNYYLKQNQNIVFKTYDNASKMIAGIAAEEINAFILPKTIYFKEITSLDLNIAYNITELNSNLVIRLGDNKKLNTIIKKYFKNWYKENYNKSFDKHFSSNYFTFRELYDESIAAFKSKQYKYGFVNYEPYDSVINGEKLGVNADIINEFVDMTGVDVEYIEFNSLPELVKNFNENKIDFFLNTTSTKKFDMDTFNTVSIYDEKFVALTNIENDIVINSPASLKNYKVLAIKDSKIAEQLKEWDITVTEFNNMNKLIKSIDSDSVIVIDDLTYEIYRHKALEDYKIVYSNNLEKEYNFVIRDIKDNKIFSNFFNFYLSFINDRQSQNKINYLTFSTKVKNNINKYILIISGTVVLIAGCIILIIKNKKRGTKKKESSISKENKLKYIDILTSLKNRNYLNDNMDNWDDSEVYPQAVIIADLNNIAYINDNYGHEEGDKIIKEAANILIKTQIERTEIIRTNGNEFLIYLVGYEEKQIISYMRKLNKEFKDLAHGFGAALGYSMINDALKTIDDAINEATLDMRNNKEEVNN